MGASSFRRSWLAAGVALAIAALTVGSLRTPSAAIAGVVPTNTPGHQETGFSDGTMAPFRMCTTQRPNYGRWSP